MLRLTFTVDDLPDRAEVERRGRARLAALEVTYGRLDTCEAAIAGWHRRNAPGQVFHAWLSVRVDHSSRRLAASCIQDDALQALEGALAGIEHQLTHLEAPAADRSGHVVELLPEHGFGVVVTDAGVQVPVRRCGEHDRLFERLHLGDRVWFAPERDDSKPGARIVHVA